jgi:hypothetical protein
MSLSRSIHLRFSIVIIALLLLSLNRSSAQSDVIAEVTTYMVVVYDHYSASGTPTGTFMEGARLRILGREDEPGNGGIWVFVTPVEDGITGWVLSAYLDFGVGFDLTTLPVFTGNQTSPPPANTLAATTRATLDLRAGPDGQFPVIASLAPNVPVTITARTRSAIWLQLEANGLTGWTTYTFLEVPDGLQYLPIIDSSSDLVVAETPPITPVAPPMDFTGIIPSISPHVRQIYLRGQELGNNRHVFSKIGDSITASTLFLTQFGRGMTQLHDYAYLQPVIEHFSEVSIGGYTPFTFPSLAARTSWQSGHLLDPNMRATEFCWVGESPLVCEYRSNMPAVALIMIGTNDLAQINSGVYRDNLETIVQISIERGIIPVLSTIPDRLNSPVTGRVLEFNQIIRDVALTYDIPLWDYWLAMQRLPNLGISIDDIHPSYATDQATAVFTPEYLRYGYNMRNLTALLVLEAVWRGAMY